MREKLWFCFFWLYGISLYSILVAMVPGAILVLGGLMSFTGGRLIDLAKWITYDLPWSIKIPVFIISIIYLLYLRPPYKSE